jgi:hypothetical protein
VVRLTRSAEPGTSTGRTANADPLKPVTKVARTQSRVRRAWSRIAVVTTLAALATAGCGDRGDPSAEPPEIGPIRVITDAAQLSLPLDEHQMTREQDLLLQRAEWQLAVQCMARYGVDYEPPPLHPALSVVDHERLYGLLDVEEAAAWGYGGQAPARQDAAQEHADGAQPPDSQAVQELLMGPSDPRAESATAIPEDGCMGEARRELAADDRSADERVDENLIFELAVVAGQLTLEDERVQAAFDRWSDCMAKASLDYDDPWQPNNHPWPRADGTVSEREKTVATADATCKHTTNLVGTWNAVDIAFQRHLMDEYSQPLTELKRLRASRLERAAQVASGES